MSGVTDINQFITPELGDGRPNIETAVGIPLNQIDTVVNPRFTTSSERDSRITVPAEGMECYVESTKEKLIYDGAKWVGMKPRFCRSEVQITYETNLAENIEGLLMTLEPSSLYHIWGSVRFYSDVSTLNDFALSFQVPSGVTGFWTVQGHPHGISSNDIIFTGEKLWSEYAGIGSLNVVQFIPFWGILQTDVAGGDIQAQAGELFATDLTQIITPIGSYMYVNKVG